jgi:POT family proton-dependent oligopeptide transporter
MGSVAAQLEDAGKSVNLDRHPTGLWFFFWGEFAERCSYYGMRAILPLYLAGDPTGGIRGGLGLGEDRASPIYFSFKMGCYFLPLIGGWLADRFFGKYWTIVGFSIPYVLGHFLLGIENLPFVLLALVLLAGGSGVIKPNISTLMGMTYDQQRPGKTRLRTLAFQWFYFSINVGAVISTFALPPIRSNFGYGAAFQFPAWLMVAALFIFAAGKKYYAVETPQPRTKDPEERKRQWQAVVPLLGIFTLLVFWWMGYEHNDSLWVYFARDHMNLEVPFLGTLSPDQVQFLNPACVLLFVPLFTWGFGKIDPLAAVFTPVRKILMGFMLTVIAIGSMFSAAYIASMTGQKVAVYWLAAAYILLTAGEVLVYGTGLELAYTAAPKNMKGLITACFLVTNALGNLINMWFSRMYGLNFTASENNPGTLTPTVFFAVTGLVVLTAGIMFYFVGKRFDKAQREARALGTV